MDSVAIGAEVPAKLARNVTLYGCPVSKADRLDVRTDWVAQQSTDATIARVKQLFIANARADADELEANPALMQIADF